MPTRSRAVWLLLSVAALMPAIAAAQDLRVAAAADLQAVFPQIAARFEQETGRRLGLTFGSSGNFFAQIQNGAPFDLFFSADVTYAARLEATGLAERGSLWQYARGRIVLWTRKDSGIDVRQGLAVLARPEVKRIAVANPEHAPYGRAALAAVAHEKFADLAQPKFVLGESISQAAQFAESGNAEVGILALSLARTPALQRAGAFYEIPESFHPPIEQAVVIVNSSNRKLLARQFIEFLKRPAIGRLMQDFGFGTP